MDHCHTQQKTSLTPSITAFILGISLLTLSMLQILPPIESGKPQVFWLVISAATLMTMIYAGKHFFVGAWHSFRLKSANMNTLISLGTGAAWLYSTIISLTPDMVPLHSRYAYFDTALIVIALVNIGAYIEARAQTHTSDAIQKLLHLQAKTARVIIDNDIKEIPIEEVNIGDHLQVRPGEKIPVDGEVLEGISHVDESMLTGEAIPTRKAIRDTLTAGTINKESVLVIKAKKIGKDTVLAQMIDMVKKAQTTRPPVAKLVDIIASIFVPIVIIIAIISGVLWAIFGPEPKMTYSLMTGLSILLIACPCALGLATPISITLGIGKAAEQGILIRNAEALQNLKKVHTIVLDKTGTLTEGHPSVSDVITFNNTKPEQLIQYAFSLEFLSEHPLALAINRYAKEGNIEPLKVQEFLNLPGLGVTEIGRAHV